MTYFVLEFFFRFCFFVILMCLGSIQVFAQSWNTRQTATDHAGHTVAVWGTIKNSLHVIEAATLQKEGKWSEPVIISTLETDASYPSLVVEPLSGNAVAVWIETDSNSENCYLKGSMLPFGGIWTSPQLISPPTQNIGFKYSLTMNEENVITAIWADTSENREGQINRAMTLFNDWSPPEKLSSYQIPSHIHSYLTDGFTIHDILTDLSYNPSLETRLLIPDEQQELEKAINQSYHYLKKDKQFFTFLSQDGQYVIKFINYKSTGPESWVEYFPQGHTVLKYPQEITDRRIPTLQDYYASWKMAFDYLKQETGLVFMHINKSKEFNKKLSLYDKLGLFHSIDLNQTIFCVQRKTDLLYPTLIRYRQNGELKKAQDLIVNLLKLFEIEYRNEICDKNSYWLQDIGILQNGYPVKLDIGKFGKNAQMKIPVVYYDHLFNKTSTLKLWLVNEFPELATFLESELQRIMGPIYTINANLLRSRQTGDIKGAKENFLKYCEAIAENKELTKTELYPNLIAPQFCM